MKKQIFTRALLGFPLGVAVGYIITIAVSLIWADGYYTPCVPELKELMGSEINAVMLQALLSGLLGAGFGGGSIIWELDNWSLVKQTGIYFLIISSLMLPVAYFTYWMEHSTAGFLSYFGIFVLIFTGIWIFQFFTGKRNVKKLKAGLNNIKMGDGK